MSEQQHGCRLLQTGTLDLDSGQLHRHSGDVVTLTRLELSLLRYLDARAGEVVSAAELHAEVWGHASRVVSRAVDNTASRLRKKIEAAGVPPVHLKRIPNEGFVFELEPSGVPSVEVPPEPFFGRTAELASLAGLLAFSPLVEVLGPGGIGKTRLVQEALLRAPPARSVWVDLTAVHDRAGLLSAVAVALGVPPGRLDALLPSLHDTLVVVDNAEQVVALVREKLAAWRGGLRWVVTSRRALRLRGAQTLRLGPLDPDSTTAMLCERAGSRRSGWGTRERDLSPLAGLASVLEGWPLAVELAAGRAALLTPAAMLRQLHRAPPQAPDGERPERHTSLSRTLEWSWALMAGEDQQALARLSIFQRSFTIDAALAVLGDGDGLSALERLLDHSMVAPHDSPGDTPRLSMLATIRRFATATLGPAEAAAASRRAAAFFAEEYDQRAFQAFSQSTPEGDELRLQLHEEHDNLLAAMRSLLDGGEIEEGMWLARMLLEHLSAQHDYARSDAVAADALARKPDGATSSQDLPVALLQGFGWIQNGEPVRGRARLEEVAALAAAQGLNEYAHSAHYMRLTALMRGWHAAPLAAAADAARRTAQGTAWRRFMVARTDCMQGGWEARYTHLEPQGRARLEALREQLPQLQSAFIRIYVLIGLATAALTRREPVEAERLSHEAIRATASAGQDWPFGALMLTRALLMQGRPAEARDLAEQTLSEVAATQRRELPEARLLLSRACHDLGERERAAALLAQVRDDLARHPYDKTRAQWHLERARQARSPALADEQRARARALVPDGAPVPANIPLGPVDCGMTGPAAG